MVIPTEASEQVAVVRWLTRHRVFFAAVPNGGLRRGQGGGAQRSLGVRPGMPDLLIFDAPPQRPDKHGVALEMKRAGATASALSQAQLDTLNDLAARGWALAIGYGATDAIWKLKALGYGAEP